MPHADRLSPRAARHLVLALLTCALVACGGGDSSPGSPATPTQPATPDTTVKPEMRCAP
ncbi:hypothetical protein [Variovorax sp. ZT4R33]|uniref:hypothetical protein n=1 Tax=Variovorax sp. ZT4R33 TaxID=3443743 RepID=UPI003F472489